MKNNLLHLHIDGFDLKEEGCNEIVNGLETICEEHSIKVFKQTILIENYRAGGKKYRNTVISNFDNYDVEFFAGLGWCDDRGIEPWFGTYVNLTISKKEDDNDDQKKETITLNNEFVKACQQYFKDLSQTDAFERSPNYQDEFTP